MRRERIENSLKSLVQNIHYLDLEDESHQHAGRAGQESHFKILLVSNDFVGKSRVQRQRSINEQLKSEFETGLHALKRLIFCRHSRVFMPEAYSGSPQPLTHSG